jgi:hypothetical protein
MDSQRYATFWVNYEAQAKQWTEWAEAREK